MSAVLMVVTGCEGESQNETHLEGPHAGGSGRPSIEESQTSPAAAARFGDVARSGLEALGYVEVTEEVVDPNRVGVVVYDRERAQPGYNLYCNHNSGLAELIDMEGSLIQSWNDPEIRQWSGCKLLANGDLLGVGLDRDPNDQKSKADSLRGFSRVIEVDPVTNAIVWQYQAVKPGDFFTMSRGANQCLANGNTLITNSDHGQAFEVTREGEIVWEFLNPHLTPENRRPTMRRAERYSIAFIDGILAGHAAKPPLR